MSCSCGATPRWVSPFERCSTAPGGSPSSPPSRPGRPCPARTSTPWSSTSPFPGARRPSTWSGPASTAGWCWSWSRTTTRRPSRPTTPVRWSSARSRSSSCGIWSPPTRPRPGPLLARGVRPPRSVPPPRRHRTATPRPPHRAVPSRLLRGTVPPPPPLATRLAHPRPRPRPGGGEVAATARPPPSPGSRPEASGEPMGQPPRPRPSPDHRSRLTQGQALHRAGRPARGGPRRAAPVRAWPARRAPTPVGEPAGAGWRRCRSGQRATTRPAARARERAPGGSRVGGRQPASLDPGATPTGAGNARSGPTAQSDGLPASAARTRRHRTGTHAAWPDPGGVLGGSFRSGAAVDVPPPRRPPGRSQTRARGPGGSLGHPIGIHPGVRTGIHAIRGSPGALVRASRLANRAHRVPTATGRGPVAPRTLQTRPGPAPRGQAVASGGQTGAVRRGQAGTSGRDQARTTSAGSCGPAGAGSQGIVAASP